MTTTLDVPLQQAANKAVNHGLRRIDKRRGFRKPTRNVVATGGSVETYSDPAGRSPSSLATTSQRSWNSSASPVRRTAPA